MQEWQQKRYLRREVELPEPFIAQAYKPIRGLFEPNVDRLNSMGVRTEFIGSREGLGRMIAYAGQTYDIALIWVGVFVLSALALVLYGVVAQVERVLLRGMLHEGK